jgi:hypothetical protein
VLTAVTITNNRGNTLTLPLADTSSGYAVRDIEGLDPVDATLTTSSLAQQDGADPQNAQRGTRNITMKLGIEPNWATNDVRSLRSALYDYLMPKALIIMGFIFDGVLFAVTPGQVESFANVMFSADPEVDVSIICYKPDFYGPMLQTISGVSRTDNTSPTIIDYGGTSDTGFIFTLNVDRVISELVLTNTAPDGELQKMTITSNFIAGDTVVINTIPGSKAITLIRSGLPSSLLSYYDLTSAWISLKRGSNSLKIVTPTAGVPFTISYTPLYGGL